MYRLRYFNAFGRRQNPNGAYAAVIPKFVIQLMNHESPVINGAGDYFRDFTYIENVMQMNERAMLTENPEAINQFYNTAVGGQTTIREMAELLRKPALSIRPGNRFGSHQIRSGSIGRRAPFQGEHCESRKIAGILADAPF